jgi:hypothetical protein
MNDQERRDEMQMLNKLTFDRLSLCFNEPNAESVKKTCGLILSDKYHNDPPGILVTKNQRYEVSCQIPLPSNIEGVKTTVCFEAGPRLPGQASFRIGFNPSKLSPEGCLELMSLLSGWIAEDETIFFYSGKITRCDIALDFPGYCADDVIIRSCRLQKHGVYSNRHGDPETTYMGTPRGRRVVAYDKEDSLGLVTGLRLECRLKPKPAILGHQLATLANPFDHVELLPADFSDAAALGIPAQYVADSCRIGGLKRALKPLDAPKRKALKSAYGAAKSLIPDLDSLWATWPDVLIACGLGKELGAIPAMVCKAKAALAGHLLEICADIGTEQTGCS